MGGGCLQEVIAHVGLTLFETVWFALSRQFSCSKLLINSTSRIHGC